MFIWTMFIDTDDPLPATERPAERLVRLAPLPEAPRPPARHDPAPAAA
jgi:hypothetical protein